MPIISLIAAVDENYGLGNNNKLLCHLPADLKYFKATTLGKPIIMGRNTFQSIGKPLPGRRNIIVSRTLEKRAEIEIASSVTEALALCGNVEELMIIGGAELFRQTLPIAERLYLTHIHHHFVADVFFPVISLKEWCCLEKINHQADGDNVYEMTFSRYERIVSSFAHH